MTHLNEAAPLPRRRDVHRPSGRPSRTSAPRATARGARFRVPVALGVMALATGMATGVSASAGTASDTARSVTTEPNLAAASAGSESARALATTPGRAGSDAEALAAAQAALQDASLVTVDALSVPADQLADIEEQAAAVRALLETRGTPQAASRASERMPLATNPPAAAASAGDASADPATRLADEAESLRVLLDEAAAEAVDIEAAPPTPTEILAEQKKAAKKAAASLTAHAQDTARYSNGRIPAGALCELSFAAGNILRCDAAEQLERLDAAYQARFGEHLQLNDSYRSYSSQIATRASKGYLAAVPGHSNHGWGLAVDLGGGVQNFGTPQYEWMRAHAPAFGWDNPDWARPGGKKPEAWHWEFGVEG